MNKSHRDIKPESINNYESKMEELTSQDWQYIFPEIEILDADGWDRRPDYFDEDFYSTKISFQEYEQRLMMSTCQFHVRIF